MKIHIPNFRIVLLICLMVLSLSTRADYFDGVAAYDSGDFKTAFAEFEKSAGQGDANAQSILGMMYTNAQGVPQNYKKAIKWYRLAADQGDATAQYSLGVFYANGRGVLQDYKESVKWYRLAAEQGHSDAQSNLGVMYATGEGVLENMTVAYALFNVAATAGNDSSRENRDNARNRMTPSQIEAGQLLSSELMRPGNFLKTLDRTAR